LRAFTRLLRLRQICCHPALLGERHHSIPSGKIAAFRELLSEILDDGHRVLVFSQFVSLLKLLEPLLDDLGAGYERLDGSTRDRQAVCDRFNDPAGPPVLLVSLRAGGVGLNLTGADTVIHFDPWWNPAVEAQATDRAHRIGQTRTVTSIKLITAASVEEKVLLMQQEKRRHLEAVFEAGEAARSPLTLEDLGDLFSPDPSP
ncbi:MAG: DEAD/DEAH box helicase, partial [Puniceicoccaceae bacterium]